MEPNSNQGLSNPAESHAPDAAGTRPGPPTAVTVHRPRLETILRLGSLLAVLFAGASVFAAYWEMRTENAWNRNLYAFQLMLDFNNDIFAQAQSVQCAFPYHLSSQVMDSTTARRIYYAKCGTPDYELRGDIMQLLNYAEAICSACSLGIVDRETVRRDYGFLFGRWVSAFGQFIKCAHRAYNGTETGPYDVIRSVVGSWYPDTTAIGRRRSPAGG